MIFWGVRFECARWQNQCKINEVMDIAKTEVEVQFTFTLPIDESFLQHKTDAERKAKEAFVLEHSSARGH